MIMANYPAPNYEYEIAQLRRAYEDALDKVSLELTRLGATDFERAQTVATLAEIKRILKELNDVSDEWASANMERAVTDGIVRSLVSLGLVADIAEAQAIVKFSRLNRELVKSAVADTQADLLAVTQNIERKTRQAIRQAAATTMRSNLTRGINGTQTIRRDILAQLDSATKTGIIDAAGRRWKPQVYVEMAVRTKMLAAHKEATINDALSRGVYYAIISSHGATDACRNWEGKIVKLTPEADGDYPYVGDLPRREIFHPNCKHVISPVRKPERV